MDAISNLVAAWFLGLGIPPMLGAFLVGVVFTYLVLPRRKPLSESAPATVGLSYSSKSNGTQTVEYDGREIEVSAAVMEQIKRGNRIAAIKALRRAAPLELIDAKRIVDALAARG